MKSFLAVAALLLLLSGCGIRLAGLLLEESVIVRSASRLSGAEASLLRAAQARATTTGLVITDVRVYGPTLQRARLVRVAGKPQLKIVGEVEPFGEVINGRTIRHARLGDIALPGDLHVVKGRNVNVRTGPGMDYSVVKQIGSDDLLLVRSRRDNGWFEVELMDAHIGFVHGTLLASVVETDVSRTVLPQATTKSESTVIEVAVPIDENIPDTDLLVDASALDIAGAWKFRYYDSTTFTSVQIRTVGDSIFVSGEGWGGRGQFRQGRGHYTWHRPGDDRFGATAIYLYRNGNLHGNTRNQRGGGVRFVLSR